MPCEQPIRLRELTCQGCGGVGGDVLDAATWRKYSDDPEFAQEIPCPVCQGQGGFFVEDQGGAVIREDECEDEGRP